MNTTCLYQLPAQSSCQMMSYVLRTAVGRLIVMDGGCRADADALLALLEKLAGPRPAVEAWFLTHAHDDHIGALTELLENKCSAFFADRILCNFPSHEWLTSHDAGGHALQCLPNLVQTAGSRISRVAAGDRFVIDDMTFQVLRVPELQITANAVNNSSVVFRLTVEKGQSVLFTGDLGEEAGDALLKALPPEDIRADVVQMAHHGQYGVNKAFYAAVAPRVCLWPTPNWLWENDSGGGRNSGPWQTLETRRWVEELGISEHLISKDGLGVLPLRNL